MPRVKNDAFNQRIEKELLKDLWEAVAQLNNVTEVENFFTHLLSDSERIMLARRIRIARLLLEGKTYDDICALLHTSHTTVGKVHLWLQGRDKDKEKVLKQLSASTKPKRKNKAAKEDCPQPHTFEWMRKKYPLHFLLFNLILDAKDKG